MIDRVIVLCLMSLAYFGLSESSLFGSAFTHDHSLWPDKCTYLNPKDKLKAAQILQKNPCAEESLPIREILMASFLLESFLGGEQEAMNQMLRLKKGSSTFCSILALVYSYGLSVDRNFDIACLYAGIAYKQAKNISGYLHVLGACIDSCENVSQKMSEKMIGTMIGSITKAVANAKETIFSDRAQLIFSKLGVVNTSNSLGSSVRYLAYSRHKKYFDFLKLNPVFFFHDISANPLVIGSISEPFYRSICFTKIGYEPDVIPSLSGNAIGYSYSEYCSHIRDQLKQTTDLETNSLGLIAFCTNLTLPPMENLVTICNNFLQGSRVEKVCFSGLPNLKKISPGFLEDSSVNILDISKFPTMEDGAPSFSVESAALCLNCKHISRIVLPESANLNLWWDRLFMKSGIPKISVFLKQPSSQL